MPVHHRACGEHNCRCRIAGNDGGSSPRVRGTRHSRWLRRSRERFIPARAGNTQHSHSGCSAKNGSSPRVRGTLCSGCCFRLMDRFIPARAGNTIELLLSASTPTVHPRACGEHSRRSRSLFRETGSSPRVRGTPPLAASRSLAGRFIPARAGNTCLLPPAIRNDTVHPRACGEHLHKPSPRAEHDGSSPRVRGTRECFPIGLRSVRFIPARAGNTDSQSMPSKSITVHPRACGEHGKTKSFPHALDGSSPRVRGTPGDEVLAASAGRFIPARAGNTTGYASGVFSFRFIPARAGNTDEPKLPPQSLAVHPRACGEHRRAEASSTVMLGSSPRVRGTLVHSC